MSEPFPQYAIPFRPASRKARVWDDEPRVAEELCRAVRSQLGNHIGRERGIAARHLAARVGATPRRLRLAIEALRRHGMQICGTPQTGYFLAETADELQESIAFLQHRALKSLMQIAAMRRIVLPRLAGQKELFAPVNESEVRLK